jgi:UDP-glucose 4-epimerase
VVSEELLQDGCLVLVLDNLQQGHPEAIPEGARFVRADLNDPASLDDLFRNNQIEAVMHMAAETVVECSMSDPSRYFYSNVVGGLNLLEAMRRGGVDRIIFSSSAAVYGEPQNRVLDESDPRLPVNSYGESKLMFERMLAWYGQAYALKHISLRYFNAAGATELLGEDHRPETHLIPTVLMAAVTNRPVRVFGTDYPTRDGSCIRDYVHVRDIAQAHLLALAKLCSGEATGTVYNLGNGDGCSVMEVVETARRVTGATIPVRVGARRVGDPAVLVANSALAQTELGWKPAFPEIEPIIDSAWRWMKDHPKGYGPA